jgi:hypothetical protein
MKSFLPILSVLLAVTTGYRASAQQPPDVVQSAVTEK